MEGYVENIIEKEENDFGILMNADFNLEFNNKAKYKDKNKPTRTLREFLNDLRRSNKLK